MPHFARYTRLGPALRELRDALGLDLSAVSRRAGLPPAYLSRLENGQLPRPGAGKVCRLLQALRVPRRDWWVYLELAAYDADGMLWAAASAAAAREGATGTAGGASVAGVSGADADADADASASSPCTIGPEVSSNTCATA